MDYKIWMLSMYIIWDMLSSIIILNKMRMVWFFTRETPEMYLKLLFTCIMQLIRVRWVPWMHLQSCIYTVNTIQWVGNGLWSKMWHTHANYSKELPMKEVWKQLRILEEFILLVSTTFNLKDRFKIRMAQGQSYSWINALLKIIQWAIIHLERSFNFNSLTSITNP
jgi:hypothetical protein